MNIIFLLSYRYLKQNRKRTIATILGISMAVMLITVVAFFVSIMNTYVAEVVSAKAMEDAVYFENVTKVQIQKFSVGIMILIISVSSVFIYNSYAISYFEKMKFLGMLGSVGATSFQKKMCILGEGILEAIIGIPLGFVSGVLVTKGLLRLLQSYVFGSEEMVMSYDWKTIALIIICSMVTVLISCMYPSIKAGKISIIDLLDQDMLELSNYYKILDLKKENHILSVEAKLALKNILVHKIRYMSTILTIVVMLCILLVGYVYINGTAGNYNIKDERKRPPLSLWVEIHSTDKNKISMFYEKMKEQEEVTHISLERTLDLNGFVVEERFIQEDAKRLAISDLVAFEPLKFEIEDTLGIREKGYLIWPQIIGLDDETFSKYLDETGGNYKDEKYPVIVEDYVLVKGDKPEGYRPILNISKDRYFPFSYSKYGDLKWMNLAHNGKVDELKTGAFWVLAKTELPPDNPYYSKVPKNIQGLSERDGGVHRFYMPLSKFENLLEDTAYKSTYGKHPQDTEMLNYWEYKSIPTYIKFDIERKSDAMVWSLLDQVLYHQDIIVRSQEDEKFKAKIEQIAVETGLKRGTLEEWSIWYGDGRLSEDDSYALGSAAIWEMEKYTSSPESLLYVLAYGITLLITAFILTNILQRSSTTIKVRRREFAMLMSMGMTKGSIYKMLLVENGIYGVIAGIIGIPLSVFLTYQAIDSFDWYYSVKIELPYAIIGVQVAVLFIVTVCPIINAIAQFRKLNIIGAIRNENQ